jgi:hypothetical protein
MALIVEYHVVADMYAVGASEIAQGMLVSFGANGIVASPNGTDLAIGIAGDAALSSEGKTTAYSAELTIGANGQGTRFTENRVSDFYDETTASQKITVYNGGGKFWVSSDLLDGGVTLAAGEFMRVGATNGYWLDGGTSAVGDTVAIAAGTVAGYDSGVPGTDTASGSISLGDYFPVILRI